MWTLPPRMVRCSGIGIFYICLPVTAIPMFVISKLAASDEPQEYPNQRQIENVPIGVVGPSASKLLGLQLRKEKKHAQDTMRR